MNEIEKYLNNKYSFKYNEVLNRTFYKEKIGQSDYKLVDKFVFNSILRDLKKAGIKCASQDLNCLLESDFVNKYNPFTEYFNKLPKWDGKTDHIKALASTVSTTDDELFLWALKKWLVALVGCAMDENITNHCVLIFTGKQGVGKTKWVVNLMPKELKNYFFSGNINPANKDSTLMMSEKLIINMDEMSSYNKRQIEGFKELITKEVISERRSYDRFSENYVRRASFTGSANHNEILMDVTGNRRFLVFEVSSINYLHSVDLGFVFGQARALFDSGYKYYFDNQDIEKIEENNKQFVQTSCEEEYLDKFFKNSIEDSSDEILYMNATEIIDYIKANVDTYISIDPVSMGKLLKAKKFGKKR